MRTLARALALLLPVTLLAACDEDVTDPGYEPPPEEVFGVESRGWGYSKGTIKMNTNVLNGADVSTVRFGYPTAYGQEVTDIYLTNVGWLGADMATVRVVDGALQATKSGQTISAHAFEGSVWFMEVNGEFAYMILEDVRYAGEVGLSNYGSKLMTNLDPDRLVYKWTSPYSPTAGTKVDSKTGLGGAYDGVHTCAKDGDGDVWTIMSRGLLINEASGDVSTTSWNMNQYAYIGCLSGAAAKTMMWGYSHDNPNGGLPNVGLAEYEAALRATRADFCGDGKAHTQPGKAVTLLDSWGINQHHADATTDEAVFGPSGALCVETPRWSYYTAPIKCGDGRTIPLCRTFSHCVAAPLWKCYYDTAEDVFNEDSSALIWTRNAAF